MGKPKNDHLTDQPMPSPTWKPDPKEMDLNPKPVPGREREDERPPAGGGKSQAEQSGGGRSR
jgi:hypothetical protein